MSLTLIIVLTLGAALIVSAAVVTLVAVRHAPVGLETEEGFKFAEEPGPVVTAKKSSKSPSFEVLDAA